ncbi:MAG: hypothetical protein O7F11_02625 [Acidobacteria bacterium]|nr:hypothetical protein [Acidobacteriota bacterium]MCZ6832619.1 hypothetical protein [Acidobacteriota bacterium]
MTCPPFALLYGESHATLKAGENKVSHLENVFLVTRSVLAETRSRRRCQASSPGFFSP